MDSVSQMFDLALQHHQAGDFHQAELLYRQILHIDPQHVDALHLFGLIAHQAGRNDLAVDYIQQALRLHPEFPVAHYNLGIALSAQGKLEEATASFREALRQKPDYAEAHNNLGNILKGQGKLDEAIAHFQQAVRLKPDFFDVYNTLGNALGAQGKFDEAVAKYRQALRLKPDYPEAHNNLAVALQGQGKLDEAIAHCRQALRLKPDFAEAHGSLGNVLRDQGKCDEAFASYCEALRLKPDFAEAHNNMGNALREQGKLEEAMASFQQALRLKPDFAEAHSNLGMGLQDQGKLDESIASYRQALSLKPDYAEVYSNLANAQADQEKFDEAMANYRQALRLNPNSADAHFNRAMQLLLLGNFDEGWAEYEWRWRSKEFFARNSFRPSLSEMAWDGSPLEGRTIMLQVEQGLGDAIQFVCYAPLLKQNGAGKVVVACPPPLQLLLSRCSGVDQVVTEIPLPALDIHAYLLSLPRLLKTTSIERIPANVPYLDCDPVLVERWQKRIADWSIADCGLRIADSNASLSHFNPQSAIRNPQFGESAIRNPQFHVGIAWQGNPKNARDRWRSVRLEQFAPLAELPGVRLISLQKGPGSEQLEKLPDLALNLGPELTDLADTAAVIRCLDLVITVDSAVAHLAGALGAPVWLALTKVPDWRWLLDRSDSPWYPTMRLFRQTERGQWDDVFRRIKNALATHPLRVP